MPSKTHIYQIKVTLKDSKPPIWRRLLVRSDMTLGDLHTIIQAAMAIYNTVMFFIERINQILDLVESVVK